TVLGLAGAWAWVAGSAADGDAAPVPTAVASTDAPAAMAPRTGRGEDAARIALPARDPNAAAALVLDVRHAEDEAPAAGAAVGLLPLFGQQPALRERWLRCDA